MVRHNINSKALGILSQYLSPVATPDESQCFWSTAVFKEGKAYFLGRNHLTHGFHGSVQLMRRLVAPVQNLLRKKQNE